MSEYTAIRAISQTLRELLTDNITEAGVTVSLKTPKEMRAGDSPESGISVWLYRVTRNEFLLNQKPRRTAPDRQAQRPIPVNLHYLITPLMNEPVDEQSLLGRALQLFHDHPIIRGSLLRGSLAGTSSEFRISLETLTLEELTRIWGALQESYQTSLTYLVQVVHIDSERADRLAPPVESRSSTYSQVLDVT